MSAPLLAPTFLFRFAAPCRFEEFSETEVELSEQHRLPCFGELEGKRSFAEVRAAWNESGLVFEVRVTGKAQPPWCRETRLEDSDGLHLWIDTRCAANIHRASQFCHRFAFLPLGGGSKFDQPVAGLVPIHRAKGNPRTPGPRQVRVSSQLRRDGYSLRAGISAAALTGFDPVEHPRLGFCYAVIDRELGWQTFTMGPEFPFAEDPSLWGALDLTRSSSSRSGRSRAKRR